MTQKIDLNPLIPTLEKMLKNGKTVQMEYNHQRNDVKILVADIKRVKIEK